MIAQIERQVRDLEVRGWNPGLGLNISPEFKLQKLCNGFEQNNLHRFRGEKGNSNAIITYILRLV